MTESEWMKCHSLTGLLRSIPRECLSGRCWWLIYFGQDLLDCTFYSGSDPKDLGEIERIRRKCQIGFSMADGRANLMDVLKARFPDRDLSSVDGLEGDGYSHVHRNYSEDDNWKPGAAEAMCDLVRDVVGNPWLVPCWNGDSACWSFVSGFQVFIVRREWQTGSVIDVARAIYNGSAESGVLDRDGLQVLSDALVDAGCPEEIRIPCRVCNGHGFFTDEIGSEWPCIVCNRERGQIFMTHPFLAALRSSDIHYRGMRELDFLLGLR